MSQLRKLWLDSNELTQLPEELGECTALQVRQRHWWIEHAAEIIVCRVVHVWSGIDTVVFCIWKPIIQG